MQLYPLQRRLFPIVLLFLSGPLLAAVEFSKPYTTPRTERNNVFEFTQKPTVKFLGNDKYEIAFAVKAYCDVTVSIVDKPGTVVRHIGSGVLGSNAPEPFQKNALQQTIYWDGKDDLDGYPKEPEKLRVQVRLGLKPEFDKRLGGTHSKDLPGFVWGIVADQDGVYVFPRSGFLNSVRKYDHDGNYIKTIHPPAADTPPEKMGGMFYTEYEKGKRGLLGPEHFDSHKWGRFMPNGVAKIYSCQPAVANGRLYFPAVSGLSPNMSLKLHWIFNSGGTEVAGMEGLVVKKGKVAGFFFYMTASPDGKHIYFSGLGNGSRSGSNPFVLRKELGSKDQARIFVGHESKPGKGNSELNDPGALACDQAGNLYVADTLNNRIQIFSPDGKYKQSIKVDRPRMVQVHQKTGSIYVAHAVRTKGRSSSRLTKFNPLPDCKKEFSWDGLVFNIMALDSWSKKPRLWLSKNPIGKAWAFNFADQAKNVAYSVKVLEEDHGKLKPFLDFDKIVREKSGKSYHGRFVGNSRDKVVCDPVREQVYYSHAYRFDLRTGNFLGTVRGNTRGGPIRVRYSSFDDLGFDKYGYMHGGIANGMPAPRPCGIARINPEVHETFTSLHRDPFHTYAEVPYDYGIEARGWKGIIPVYKTDHHGWTWGMGTNIRGDLAIVKDIEFVPGMPDLSFELQNAPSAQRAKEGGRPSSDGSKYAAFMRALQERQKSGEEFYSVKRRPGTRITQGTIFTWDRTGEVRSEGVASAGVGAGTLSVQLDRLGNMYFCCANQGRTSTGRAFMGGNSGWFGNEKRTSPTSTGVYVKAKPRDVLFMYENGTTPLDPVPDRPADMFDKGGKSKVWAKNAEWIYAGASPFPIPTCSCPQLRADLDWYDRSYVPESYRHSIGILDTNGNLILHVGQYGNHDSANGPKSKVPVGGDGIASTFIRFVSTTDNYLVFGDWGERLVVLKLNYHAEETVGITLK